MSAKKKKVKRRGERIYIPYQKEEKKTSWIPIIILLCTGYLAPLAALLLLKKGLVIWKNKKLADYRAYAAVIGDRCEVDVHEMSAKLGKTPSLVYSDLQTMINKGYMGDKAYLDRSRGVLVLEPTEAAFEVPDVSDEIDDIVDEAVSKVFETADYLGSMFKSATARSESESPRSAPEPEPAAQPQPEPQPEPQPAWREDEFEEKLRQIRALNDEIKDEGVSRRIDRIGGLTASIFTVVRQKPERAAEVKKFMNYYLPTTCKLLKSYALMEKQSYQGENIMASRRKIEDILDSLITAFEQQQDRLFRTEALDVEADIQVLETMMAKDGLVTPKGMDLRAMGGQK